MTRGTKFIFNGHTATVLGNFADFTKVSYVEADGSIVIAHIPRHVGNTCTQCRRTVWYGRPCAYC